MLPVLYEIMDLVKAYDAVLCTGHVSAAEADLIIRNGLDYGCRMMLTHPEILFIQMPAEAQKELAQKGAYIEKCWLNVFTGAVSADEMCRNITYIGPGQCILSTDLGQADNPLPMEDESAIFIRGEEIWKIGNLYMFEKGEMKPLTDIKELHGFTKD